jgi:hypothetical protein
VWAVRQSRTAALKHLPFVVVCSYYSSSYPGIRVSLNMKTVHLLLTSYISLFCAVHNLAVEAVRHNQSSAVGDLPALELRRWKEIIARRDDLNFEIAGFYHVHSEAQLVSIETQVLKLEGARSNGPGGPNLLQQSEFLYVDIEKSKHKQDVAKTVEELLLQKSSQREKYKLNTNSSVSEALFNELSQQNKVGDRYVGQLSTLYAMHSYCREAVQRNIIEYRRQGRPQKPQRKSIVYYIHSETLDLHRPKDPMTTWIRLLDTFHLEYPSVCLRAVTLNNYVTCGIEYQDGHYSGNYFWADCDHIASLPTLQTRTSQHTASHYIFNVSGADFYRDDFGRNCGYSPFHSRKNHFETPVSFADIEPV